MATTPSPDADRGLCPEPEDCAAAGPSSEPELGDLLHGPALTLARYAVAAQDQARWMTAEAEHHERRAAELRAGAAEAKWNVRAHRAVLADLGQGTAVQLLTDRGVTGE